jgi:heme oxygenase
MLSRDTGQSWESPLVVTAAKLAPDLSVLQELKQKTAPHHRALEHNVDIRGCMSSQGAYGNLLLKFLAIYSAFEIRLASVESLPQWLPDISERWKVLLLKSDLSALAVPETRLVRLEMPGIETIASAFGCLYVLEGSTLGGQILTRQVQERLGLTVEKGCRFFSGYGPRTGEYWKTFGYGLESFCATNEVCRGEIVESAIATFNHFSRWLGNGAL